MPGILCEHCTAACCRYIALPIDTPEEREDFDPIRWYLIHEGVSVFVEDGDWYISFATSCRHVQPDYRCGIYETRPQICRDYSTDNCDYHSGDYGWEHHFSAPEHLDDYVRNIWTPQQALGKKRPRSNRAKRDAQKRLLKARIHSMRRGEQRYAAATTDLRGVPLPILGGGGGNGTPAPRSAAARTTRRA